ncbi:MFS transporter [Maricurvus nonylphenolicus]|uniref:spinster family MFS transporter n=1 Tax=Maricurvus nonylphenolicus TaxID=1008307 RepID=UPI0036F26391
MTHVKSASFKTAIVLGCMYSLSVMDRQIVAMLLEPIKHDMQLSDTQLALMSGLVFALFYGAMGIPIARLADRANRVNILSWCLGVWSLMTALSGMAVNFTMMLLARIGVGVGEAGCQPAGQSIIADTYEESRRARALAIFAAGAPIGGLLAYLLGGALADTYGWRVTLIAAGVPGLIFAVLIRYLITEPQRTAASNEAEQQAVIPEIKKLLATPIYRYALLGHIFCIALMYTIMIWVPTLMIRVHQLSLTEIGIIIGASSLIGGLAGSILSGVITDVMANKHSKWLGALPMLYCLLALPLFMGFLWTSSMWVSIGLLTVCMILLNAHTPPCYATYHKSVAPENRAMSVALSTLSVNIIGLGLAPLLVGSISDVLSSEYGERSLNMAMFVGAAFLPLGAYCYYKVAQLFATEHIKTVTTENLAEVEPALK